MKISGRTAAAIGAYLGFIGIQLAKISHPIHDWKYDATCALIGLASAFVAVGLHIDNSPKDNKS